MRGPLVLLEVSFVTPCIGCSSTFCQCRSQQSLWHVFCACTLLLWHDVHGSKLVQGDTAVDNWLD